MRKVIENEIRWLDFLMKKEKGLLETTELKILKILVILQN